MYVLGHLKERHPISISGWDECVVIEDEDREARLEANMKAIGLFGSNDTGRF